MALKKLDLSTVAFKDHKFKSYILQLQITSYLRTFCYLCLTGKHEARLLCHFFMWCRGSGVVLDCRDY